ncbi:MAG: MFS transporter [Pelolinea sp.]|jgi:MFS family permease|nr:MFS transporter [Pelolinea sp.]
MKSSVRKFYLASFLGGLSFTNGILILYYRNIGFSYTQIFALSIIYEVLVFLLEIPTGILADLWSRKWVIVIGHAISGISFLVVLISPASFYIFIIWSVLSAICTSLNSGSMTAIIYDSLKEENKEPEFFKVQSSIEVLILLAQTISMFLGGWIANSIGFQYTLIFSAASGLAQTAILCFVSEPASPNSKSRFSNEPQGKHYYSDFIQHFRSSIKFMFLDKNFLFISILCTLGFASCAIFNTILQPLIAISGLNSYLDVAIVIALINAITMLFVFFAQKNAGFWKKKNTLLLLLFTIAASFFIMSKIQSAWLIIPLAILNILFEMYQIITNNKINLLISSDKRATILSTQNQINSLFYSFIALFIGKAADNNGLKSLSLSLSFGFLFLSMVFFIVQKTGHKMATTNDR